MLGSFDNYIAPWITRFGYHIKESQSGMGDSQEVDRTVVISRGAVISGLVTLAVAAIIGTVSMFMVIRIDIAESRTGLDLLVKQVEKRNDVIDKMDERLRTMERNYERVNERLNSEKR